MRGALFATPSKPAKRQFGPFYWLTRDVALGLARLCPPGRILGTQRIPRGRDPILSTQPFRAAGVFRILPTHTFRVAGVLHFSTHTFGAILQRN